MIIAAHGSRKKESNAEVTGLAKQILTKIKKDFQFVEAAFLQFSDPLLGSQIDDLVEKGVTRIIIFPFFIGAGSHILIDIPDQINKAARKYPDVEFSLTRHLGKMEGIKDIIINEVINE